MLISGGAWEVRLMPRTGKFRDQKFDGESPTLSNRGPELSTRVMSRNFGDDRFLSPQTRTSLSARTHKINVFRATDMAKKRKATGTAKGSSAAAEDHSKRVRLNLDSYEDVAASDDEFHIGRDKVLLDETPREKRSRKIREEGTCTVGF